MFLSILFKWVVTKMLRVRKLSHSAAVYYISSPNHWTLFFCLYTTQYG